MAPDPNATRAAQAGKTVTTSDGYQIVYDDNGFGRKSVGPDGQVKYYDSLGNQTSTPYDGPIAQTQSTVSQADVQPLGSGSPDTALLKNEPQVQQENARISAQLEEINANMSKPKVDVPMDQMIADAKAVQDANNAKLGIVQDPVAEAESARISAQLAEIDANRKVQADAPATVDKEGIAALAAAQKENETAQKPVTDDPMAAAIAANQATNEEESPTEQKVIAASSDAKLSQEEQGQLREFQESQRAVAKAETAKAGNPEGNWTASSVNAARASQTIAVARNTVKNDDWRVRLSLAPNAKYLYNLAAPTDILYPVKLTDGVIFPYTPTIQTAYKANYDSMNLTHTNYKMYFYKNSNVDEITMTADFTAQDTTEANYLLGVIHFFKSVTKMFYGQDGNNGPKAGTPPPLCYLNGYGMYQFNEHPVLISSFTYILPNDVDYIRAGPVTVAPGTNTDSYTKGNAASKKGFDLMSSIRKATSNLLGKQKGKASSPAEPKWMNYANSQVTYVPTKMQIQLSLLPIVTRNDISKNFSLEKYATGELLKGRNRPSGGGIW